MKAKIDEIDAKWAIYRWNWAKIAIGTLSYRWNSILAVGSQIGSNLAVGSLYNHWKSILVVGSTRRERSDISPKNRQSIDVTGDFNGKSSIYRVSLIYWWYIADFFSDFLRFFPPSIFLLQMSCRPPSIRDISSIYRQYFTTFSSLLLMRLLQRKHNINTIIDCQNRKISNL